MILRATLLLLLFTVLTGCVNTGDVNPMRTDKGRDAARDAYIQLGICYLQQCNTGRAKSPLKKALELDSSNADAHAALTLVFKLKKERKLADEHFRKALFFGKQLFLLLSVLFQKLLHTGSVIRRIDLHQLLPFGILCHF